MPKYLCLSFFFYITCAQAMHEKQSSGLIHNLRLDGFLCEDYIFKLNSSSLIQCGSLCQSSSFCKGIFFDKNSTACIGCDFQSDAINFGMKSTDGPTLFYELRRDNRYTSLTGGGVAFTTTAFFTSAETLRTKDLPATTYSTTQPTNVDRSATTGSVMTTYLSTTDPFTSLDLLTTARAITTTYPPTTADPVTTIYPIMNVITSLTDEQAAKQLSNSTYWILHDVTFPSAMEMCIANSEQAHLAWVDTLEENEFLTDLVRDVRNGKPDRDKFAFLGLTGSADVLVRFPTTERQSDYFNPTTVAPLYDGDKYCVAINGRGDWVRIDCREIIAAICELELKNDMLSRA